MAKNRFHYLRKNHTNALPTRLVFIDTETRAEKSHGIDLHRMVVGWTWYVELDPQGNILEEAWTEHWKNESLADYLFSLAKPKDPLLVVGASIVVDVWSSGLAERLHFGGWTVHTLYHKGLRSILRFTKDKASLRFLSLHNYLPGSIQGWAYLLGIPRGEYDFKDGTHESLSEYCKRDTLVVGRSFLHYRSFLLEYDLGGFASTISGQALRAFRHRFMRHKILHYDVPEFNAFVRAGYHGGRTEAFRLGTYTDGHWAKLDVNSMYPYVMAENRYPTKIRQWVKSPSLAWLTDRLKTGCVMARVKLNTDQPVYPVKLNEKLCFPLGSFSATLCSSSLAYAVQHGHLVEVEEAISFHAEYLFRSYVDFFYRLKLDFDEGGNQVWKEVCKGFLNHLYGKFGELRDRELINAEDETLDFYRRPVSFIFRPDGEYVTLPGRRDFAAAFPDDRVVDGIEWCAFGRYVCCVGTEEGENSAPAIAAHVTDYARMKLWGMMEKIGPEKLWYVDTDSVILDRDAVDSLTSEIDQDELGQWKVEAVADYLDLRGAKDYSLGEDSKQKGIRRDAVGAGIGRVSQPVYPSLYTLLRHHSFQGYPIGQSVRSTSTVYDKGHIGADGRVHPFRLKDGAMT